ncbi:hypothetical protein B7494_g2527 [Chlorociboria aeruginascens]|nr:hypothetical protein B7494_g2527 [Chlorociboria aeruginascens]
MSSTPVNLRTFTANTGLGLKLTPTSTYPPRTPRSPNKTKLYESGLSLKRIIGTTVSSPTSFDCLASSGIFAYTAGAAAVVVNIDDNSSYSQRFFRARPTAIPLNLASAPSGAPSTPINTANDGRNRALVGLRDAPILNSPSTPQNSIEWGDSPMSKTWTSRERIKAATCLSISQDGRFLATGYSPRVLVFSLQDTSSDTPVAILNEHTYGVRAVAFSPDQKYLASLGSPNDGFLFVWSINQRTGAAKLHSSNKCTSSVKQMIWLGSQIITIGTRHIKVWKVEDNRPPSPSKQRFAYDGTPQPVAVQSNLKTLAGRNCLLGPLVEAIFTAIAPLSDQRAIVCSERGDVCLLDSNEGHKLIKLINTGFTITCIAVNMQNRQVKIGGRNGNTMSLDLDILLSASIPPVSPLPLASSNDAGHFCAMGYTAQSLVTIDSKHLIEISNTNSGTVGSVTKNTPFPAHGDAVMGVRLLSEKNDMNATFFTWSANGMVVFWDLDGNSKASFKVDIEQINPTEEDLGNQCQIIRASTTAAFLVVGDKYGILKIINTSTKACDFNTRAHMSEVQDIALHEDKSSIIVASCGRDRTIQLYRRIAGQWMLVQTLDEHSASVCSLFFTPNGEKIVSCSTDRTIHIRQLIKKDVAGQEIMGVVPLRIITLKASPVSMAVCLDDHENHFVVSLLDRTVATYEISTGRLVSSFRANDSDGGDAVVLDALVMGMPNSIPGRPTILAGVSSTDKSVRVYDGCTGSFLDREWGHTAAVTGVGLLEPSDTDQKIIISTGSDGTIMIWDLSPRNQEDLTDLLNSSREESPSKEATSARPPLRRVLSRAELAELQKASPSSTPTGRTSPPRVVRRKTSRYGLAQSPSIPPPPMPTATTKFDTDPTGRRRGSPRTRSRSPPPSPKGKEGRRPSLASLEPRGRVKSTGNFSEFGTLNMATEQACRTLRAYRKKLLSSESVKAEVLKELDQELRLTAMALGEKTLKSKTISETVLTGLLDQYSDRLVSMFDEKLRLSQLESTSSTVPPERPKTAGNLETPGPMLNI